MIGVKDHRTNDLPR